MNKILKYILGTLIVFLLLAIIQLRIEHKKRLKAETDRDRLESNQQQLLSENQQQTTLILTKDEWLRVQNDSIAKLLKSLAIKPKTVIKYVERTIREVDTIDKPVYINPIGDQIWQIIDTGKCFLWEGEVYFWNNRMNLNRTNFEYNNKITEVAYKRLKWKFWFIRFYDKRQVDLQSVAECGGETIKTIEVIKK